MSLLYTETRAYLVSVKANNIIGARVSCFVNVFLLSLLAKRIATINVRNMLKHLRDLFCKFQVSACNADSNLHICVLALR